MKCLILGGHGRGEEVSGFQRLQDENSKWDGCGIV